MLNQQVFVEIIIILFDQRYVNPTYHIAVTSRPVNQQNGDATNLYPHENH